MQPFPVLFRPYYILAIAILGKIVGLWSGDDARGLAKFLFNLTLPVLVFTAIIEANLSTFDNFHALWQVVGLTIAGILGYIAYRGHGQSQQVVKPQHPAKDNEPEVLHGEREMLMMCCLGWETSMAVPFVLVNLGPPELGRFLCQDYVNFVWAFGVYRVLAQHFITEKPAAPHNKSPSDPHLYAPPITAINNTTPDPPATPAPTTNGASHNEDETHILTNGAAHNEDETRIIIHPAVSRSSLSHQPPPQLELTSLPQSPDAEKQQQKTDTWIFRERYPRIYGVFSVILFPPIFGFLMGWIIKGGLQAPHSPDNGMMGPGLADFMQNYLPNGFDVFLILFLGASIDLKAVKSQLGRWALWKVHIVRLIVGFLMWSLTNFHILPYKSPHTRDILLFGFFGSVPSISVVYASIFNPKLVPIISYTAVLSLLIAFGTMLFSALVGTYGGSPGA